MFKWRVDHENKLIRRNFARTNNAEVKRMTKGAVRVYGYARQTKGSKGAASAVGSNCLELRDTSEGPYLTGRYPE